MLGFFFHWANIIFTLLEFLSYGLGNHHSCGEDCKFLWDGFGRWANGTWKPHVKGAYEKKKTFHQSKFFLIELKSLSLKFF